MALDYFQIWQFWYATVILHWNFEDFYHDILSWLVESDVKYAH